MLFYSSGNKMDSTIQVVLSTLFLLASANSNSANQICPNCESMEINLDVSGEEIDIQWTFNDSGTSVYGFRAVVYNNEHELQYQSPILHSSERHMSIHQALSGKTSVCIQPMWNESASAYEQCQLVDVKDLKAVVGILAGTIFLIPCIIGLVYIIYKDKQISRELEYEKLEQSSENSDVSTNGKVNEAFKIEMESVELQVNPEKTTEKAKMEIIVEERSNGSEKRNQMQSCGIINEKDSEMPKVAHENPNLTDTKNGKPREPVTKPSFTELCIQKEELKMGHETNIYNKDKPANTGQLDSTDSRKMDEKVCDKNTCDSKESGKKQQTDIFVVNVRL